MEGVREIHRVAADAEKKNLFMVSTVSFWPLIEQKRFVIMFKSQQRQYKIIFE